MYTQCGTRSATRGARRARSSWKLAWSSEVGGRVGSNKDRQCRTDHDRCCIQWRNTVEVLKLALWRTPAPFHHPRRGRPRGRLRRRTPQIAHIHRRHGCWIAARAIPLGPYGYPPNAGVDRVTRPTIVYRRLLLYIALLTRLYRMLVPRVQGSTTGSRTRHASSLEAVHRLYPLSSMHSAMAFGTHAHDSMELNRTRGTAVSTDGWRTRKRIPVVE